MQTEMQAALEKAVDLAGGQTEFANKLNEALGALQPPRDPEAKPIRQQHVDYWMRVSKRLPSEYARAAEFALDGRVTRYDFRPDVFGLSAEAGPPAQLALGLTA